jgi:acyl-CoA reductase-like NAD-dependent aldehyde dehydrogenase
MATTTAATASASDGARDQIIVTCPADGRVVGTVPAHTRAEVELMAAELRAAQPEWQRIGLEGRSRWMERWRDWFLDNEQRLNEMVQAESGKSTADAAAELPIVYEIINYYVKHAAEFLAPEHPKPHTPAMALKRLEIQYHPHPLLGLITPWNGPIGNPMLDLPAAMIAGCAALCKPSEFTPLTWRECIRGWREEIGAPPVLACATGAGETGAAVVDVVDMVHFTGSARTGRRIAARCGERLIPCSLELGGKDPMIVLADADLERAANAAVWGGLTNSGQICISVERVYVEEPVYESFVGLVTDKVSKIRQGNDAGQGIKCDIGAMATEDQIQIVSRHVEEALAHGARALTGGRRGDGGGGSTEGLYYEPTVLVDVDHSMACMREETFGPTIPIMRVGNADEAVRLANDSEYGLSASVWTRNRELGELVALKLNVGAVNINNVFINLFQLPLPHHGWGSSGIGGRLGGAEGIRKYCRTKAVVAEKAAAKTEIHWYPASNAKATIQARGARLMGARDWRRRLGLKPRS